MKSNALALSATPLGLAAFVATARDEVELESLADAQLIVTQETMQPGQISLWLNKSGPTRSP